MVSSSEACRLVYHHIFASTSAIRQYSASSISDGPSGCRATLFVMSSFLHCGFVAGSAMRENPEYHKFEHEVVHDGQQQHDDNLRVHDIEFVGFDGDGQQQHIEQERHNVRGYCDQQWQNIAFDF